MRSGTSLVTNILISNPEIAGFGESHIIYDRPERLLDLRYWVFRYQRRYPGSRSRLLDKVLHTEYTPDLPALLGASRPHVIVLVRDPAGTGASLKAMYAKLRPGQDVDVWTMLQTRYLDLASQVRTIPPDVPLAALSYEALLEAPEAALERLSGFLGLGTPLSSDYTLPRWGGVWGVGDGSAKIRSGTIVPQARPADTGNAPAPVRDAYEGLIEALRERCDPAVL